MFREFLKALHLLFGLHGHQLAVHILRHCEGLQDLKLSEHRPWKGKIVFFKVHCTFTGAVINNLKAVKEITGHVQQDKPYVILSPNNSTAIEEWYQVKK